MSEKKIKTKIGHSLDQLEEGLILTIQDKPVLQNGNINQSDDVLENYERRIVSQAQHNREIRQKIKTLANAATSHLEAKNQGAKGLLPHYDDYRYKSDQVDLEDGTVTKRSRPKQMKNISNDFEPVQNVNSEYYETKVKFKQRKKQKSNHSQLLQFLKDTAVQKQIDEQANSESANDIIDQSLNTIRKRKKLENDQLSLQNVYNEDEQLLSRAIKLGRQKNLQSNDILNIIKEQAENSDQQHLEINKTVIEMNPVNYRQTSSLVEKKQYNIIDAAKGTTSCLFVNLPSEKISMKKEPELPESFKDLTPQELQKMKQEISFLEQKQAGIGLSGTLNFLRQHNMLNKQEQFGRTNDKESHHNDPSDRIKLQYRNSSGKLMKPKQAFRYLSAIFHGQGPGKNKIEKIKKKQLLEMKIKQAANGPGKLLNLLEKHQSNTGQAHMVIQLGSKHKEE